MLRRLALIVLLAGCARDRPPPPAHVLLVVVDALRPDHLGCYGYARPTSPRLDAFAADATRFTNAVASSTWTLPAVATLMTSLYPSVHGARRPSNTMAWGFDRAHFVADDALDGSRTTLAEVLRAAGFRTGAFVTGAYPTRPFGFDQGFERFADNESRSFRVNVAKLFEWLDRDPPARFFAYLHPTEVHSPYAAPMPQPGEDRALFRVEQKRWESFAFDPDYRGRVNGQFDTLWRIRQRTLALAPGDADHLVALYDQGIAYLDYWLGELFDGLRTRGLLEHTLIVVTADHGEELFDHDSVEHGSTFYDETMRVPLIVRAPGIGRVVEDQVAHLDVMPTILDLTGVRSDVFVQGRSLRPLLAGGTLPERPVVGEASMTAGLRALRTRRWKYVEHPRSRAPELYDLVADPRERTNLCARDRARCRPFAADLHAWELEMKQAKAHLALPAASPAPVDDETRQRLHALGYVE